MKKRQLMAAVISFVIALSAVPFPEAAVAALAAEDVAEQVDEEETKEEPAEAGQKAEEENVVEEQTAEEEKEEEAEAEGVQDIEVVEDTQDDDEAPVDEENKNDDADEQQDVSDLNEQTENENEGAEDVTDETSSEEEPEEEDAEGVQDNEDQPEEDVEEYVVELPEEEYGEEAATAAGDVTDSGTCGNNAEWTLTETDDGLVLYITGSGSMSDFPFAARTPWYKYRNDIKQVVISDGITTIGRQAFSSMQSLQEIDVPYTITFIGAYAFYDCKSLDGIYIPDGVTQIGDHAFYNCTLLTQVSIPSGVGEIDGYTFANCTGLEHVSLPGSLMTIDECAFAYCSSLQEISLPGSIIDLGEQSFMACSGLTTVTIPGSIDALGSAFEECTGLTSVVISDGVETISSGAFKRCQNLKEITIPESVTSIAAGAFSQCDSLYTVHYEGDSQEWTATFGDADLPCGEVECTDTTIQVTRNLPDTFEIPSGPYVYNGTAQVPEPKVKYNGSTLKKGKDYTVSYKDNINVGTATVTVTGTGIYAGTASADFTISQCSVETASIDDIPDKTYCRGAVTPDVNVKVGDTTLKAGTDYDVSYESNVDAGTASVVVEGKGNYTGTVRKDFIILPVSMASDSLSVTGLSDRTYTGSAIEPEVSVKDGSAALKKGTEYTVSYANNINAGTATVAITGKGNYTGTIKKSFAILSASLTADSVSATGLSDRTYTGKAISPAVSVKNGDILLKEGTDYAVSYAGNTNAGTATVTITGKGGYTGTIRRTFTIRPVSMTSDAISVTGLSDKTYTGKAFKPAVRVEDNGKVLSEGADYSVSYKNNVNAGTATVVITGNGNYTGSTSRTFTIKKAANKITASGFTRSYSAKAQTITLGAKATGGKLTYSPNNNKVTVDVYGRIKLPAKFTGTVKVKITAADSNYNKATKTIAITVPAKTALSKVTSPSAGKMKITWKRNTSVTGYQIRYSLNSGFKGAKKATVSKNTTISKTLKRLKKGKKYYVQIRSFKTVGGKKYYSAWSTKKATRIKK